MCCCAHVYVYEGRRGLAAYELIYPLYLIVSTMYVHAHKKKGIVYAKIIKPSWQEQASKSSEVRIRISLLSSLISGEPSSMPARYIYEGLLASCIFFLASIMSGVWKPRAPCRCIELHWAQVSRIGREEMKEAGEKLGGTGRYIGEGDWSSAHVYIYRHAQSNEGDQCNMRPV